jgi:hypothetical protein
MGDWDSPSEIVLVCTPLNEFLKLAAVLGDVSDSGADPENVINAALKWVRQKGLA